MLQGIGRTHVEHEENNTDNIKSKYRENPASVLLRPPQSQHRLVWECIWDYIANGWQWFPKCDPRILYDPGYPWIHFRNVYFEMYLYFKLKEQYFVKIVSEVL
jgi:hypothetical protein